MQQKLLAFLSDFGNVSYRKLNTPVATPLSTESGHVTQENKEFRHNSNHSNLVNNSNETNYLDISLYCVEFLLKNKLCLNRQFSSQAFDFNNKVCTLYIFFFLMFGFIGTNT